MRFADILRCRSRKLSSKLVVWWLRSETFSEKCHFLKMMIFDIFDNFPGNVRNRSELVPGASKHLSKISGCLREGLRIVFCRFEEIAKNDEKSYLSIQSTSFFSPRRVLRTQPPAAEAGGATSCVLVSALGDLCGPSPRGLF